MTSSISALRGLSADARAWAGLAVLALPTLLLGLDVTLLYLTMPALAAELRPSSSQALWIMDAYGFMIAGFLVTMGTLGDRIGRRRLLMIGAAAFALTSLLAAFSSSAALLIVARALLGVAGATLMPSTLALIGDLFPDPRQRALAIGIWATMFALGMAIGPLLGGVLLAHFWWGAGFLVAVPMAVLVLLAAPQLLPEQRAQASRRLDLVSVVLSLVALLPAIYAMKEMARGGAMAPALLALLLAGLCAVAFVRRQRSLADPLLDLRLFASPGLAAALLVLLFGLVAVAGMLLMVSQYLQLVAGLSPLRAGLWMAPPALAMVGAGIGAPLLARRIRPGSVVSAALLLSASGYLLLWWAAGPGVLAQAGDGRDAIHWIVAGFSLAYLGLGTIAALGTDLVVGAAPADKAGSASALSETAQELGVALGVASLGSLATVVYRRMLVGQLPDNLAEPAARALGDSLWAASAFVAEVPAVVLEHARQAFMAGFALTALICAVLAGVLAAMAAYSLRRIGSTGSAPVAEPVRAVPCTDGRA